MSELKYKLLQTKGKHFRKPHCRNGVVDTFRPGALEPLGQFNDWLPKFSLI